MEIGKIILIIMIALLIVLLIIQVISIIKPKKIEIPREELKCILKEIIDEEKEE